MAEVTGQCPDQATLFPERLDEVVGDDHPVRVIDAFVAGLELARLGFSKVAAEATGRPPYDPGDLLKLYVYGYLNQVRSSRRLEREAQRNVEVMWLINRLAPAFKTIADFRKDHGPAIVRVCRGFIEFCRRQALSGGEVVAIDGTKIAAVASRKQVITPQRLAKQTAAVERKIADYLAALDTADREEPAETAVTMDVAAAIAALREQREKLQRQAEELAREGLTQKVVGEPEAKLMRTPHGHEVAYNAQIAVDAEHHLIVGFDLTNRATTNSSCIRWPYRRRKRWRPTPSRRWRIRVIRTANTGRGASRTGSRRSCRGRRRSIPRGGNTSRAMSSLMTRSLTAGAVRRERR